MEYVGPPFGQARQIDARGTSREADNLMAGFQGLPSERESDSARVPDDQVRALHVARTDGIGADSCCATRLFSALSSMPAANTSEITTAADGRVIKTPTTNSPRLLKPVTADQEGDASEGEDGRHPQSDEQSLLMAPREPQRDGEEEGDEGRDENGQAGTATEGALLHHRKISEEATGIPATELRRVRAHARRPRRPPRV